MFVLIMNVHVYQEELDQLLADKEYVRLVPVDDLERASRMKQIDSRIAELNKSIEKSENTINGYQHHLPQLKKMLQPSSDERTLH
ncbi:hypothetical protein DVG79_15840 [Exiguobacterium sp. RIT594]|nr:hypothetical protein DVG79_15840 [Exiguobacterium sp. RIT594]